MGFQGRPALVCSPPEAPQGWSRLPENLRTRDGMGGVYVSMSPVRSLVSVICCYVTNSPKLHGLKQQFNSVGRWAALTACLGHGLAGSGII